MLRTELFEHARRSRTRHTRTPRRAPSAPRSRPLAFHDRGAWTHAARHPILPRTREPFDSERVRLCTSLHTQYVYVYMWSQPSATVAWGLCLEASKVVVEVFVEPFFVRLTTLLATLILVA